MRNVANTAPLAGGGNYTIVLINKGPIALNARLDTENLNKNTLKAFLTSYAERRYLQATPLDQSGSSHIELPPHSMATLLVNW